MPDGRILLMDFMRSIVGPSITDIRKLAVQVRLKNEALILVMHPLLCLESRFANLAVIPSKRTGNGKMQAIWAINIVRAFLLHQAQTGAPSDQIAKAIRRIAEVAEYKHGRYCLLNFELDPLDAITPDVVSVVGGGFEQHEWPHMLSRIRDKQSHWREVHSRLQPQQKMERK